MDPSMLAAARAVAGPVPMNGRSGSRVAHGPEATFLIIVGIHISIQGITEAMVR